MDNTKKVDQTNIDNGVIATIILFVTGFICCAVSHYESRTGSETSFSPMPLFLFLIIGSLVIGYLSDKTVEKDFNLDASLLMLGLIILTALTALVSWGGRSGCDRFDCYYEYRNFVALPLYLSVGLPTGGYLVGRIIGCSRSHFRKSK